MRHTVIDIGSNTIRMNIYEVDGSGSFRKVFNKKAVAGLASYVEDGYLTGEGREKLLTNLKKFIETSELFGVDEVNIVATASLRNIKNNGEVLSYILEKTGKKIDLISGEEESELGFNAIKNDYDFSDGIIVDIGGGSTEVIYYKKNKILMETSIPEGSLSLFTKYVKRVFPKDVEYRKIKSVVRDYVTRLPRESFKKNPTIYGIGGTIRSAGNVNMELRRLSDNKFISAEMVRDLLKKLKTEDPATMKTLIKVSPERLHTIIPGLIILDELIRHTKAKNIRISDMGVREGYLLKKLGELGK